MIAVAVVNPSSAIKLGPSPLPADLITEGHPEARIWISAQSDDRKITQGVWDCTAGSFNWDYAWDEFVIVLEGEAVITPKGGDAFIMRAGDLVNFPLGLQVEWRVPKYIKKEFVLRTTEPLDM